MIYFNSNFDELFSRIIMSDVNKIRTEYLRALEKIKENCAEFGQVAILSGRVKLPSFVYRKADKRANVKTVAHNVLGLASLLTFGIGSFGSYSTFTLPPEIKYAIGHESLVIFHAEKTLFKGEIWKRLAVIPRSFVKSVAYENQSPENERDNDNAERDIYKAYAERFIYIADTEKFETNLLALYFVLENNLIISADFQSTEDSLKDILTVLKTYGGIIPGKTAMGIASCFDHGGIYTDEKVMMSQLRPLRP
jgi:hypothetical protein